MFVKSLFKSNYYLSNYQSNFGTTSNFKNDQNQNKSPYKMTNPLIAMIGISEYDRNVLPNRECVVNDYKNVQHAFYVQRGYSVVYFNKTNQLIHKKGLKISTHTKMQRNVTSRKEIKLRWTDNDVLDYNNQVHLILENKKYNYDGLIYFVSCHGDTDSVIYDSEGEKIPLIVIFEKFNNQNCHQLRNKPKIYFIEACRGNQRTKRLANSLFETVESQVVTIESNNNMYKYSGNQSNVNAVFTKYNYNREIYANTEGFGIVDPDSKGAYMTRSITMAIANNEIFKKDFDTIMNHIRKIMVNLMGLSFDRAAQVVEDNNKIPRKVFFSE